MIVALKLSFVVILSCAVSAQADVSHFGYTRQRGQHVETLRLQRLESSVTPYPAAGYRPNREFNLPRDQPLFPLANQHSDRPQINSGFDNLGETQKPQLLYGSPDQEPRFRPQNRPQNSNGFNDLVEPQQHEFIVQSQGNQQRQQSHNRGFSNFEGNTNNFAEPQQPQFVEQVQFSGGHQQSNNINNGLSNGFNKLAEPQQPPQRPDLLYGAVGTEEHEAQSARLRQQLIARLQQNHRLEQLQQEAESQRYRQPQQQQFFNSPQTLYSAPTRQHQFQTQAQSESRTNRLIAQKPARLTDNREETETESDDKASETVEEIETTTKAESKTKINQTVPAAATPVVANTGFVNYYPAAAFSFVQPFNGAAYVASSNYPTIQPAPSAYTVDSPFVPQPYALATTSPAHLQAW